MNLLVAVAIVLLHLYVVVSTGCQILHFVLSIHFPDVPVFICVEVNDVIDLPLCFLYDTLSG